MTEERKKELARNFFETSTEDIDGDIWELVCTVADEAREEGRKEGIEEVLRFFEEGEEDTMWRPYEITDAIERLKEQG